MLKRFLLFIFEIAAAILGNLIAGWIQQDIWTNFFSPARIVGSVVSIICITLIMLLLGSDNIDVFSWNWHRYWFLHNLVHNSKLNHWSIDYAQLDISEAQRKQLTVDVVVAGERRNLLDLLTSSIFDKKKHAARILVLGEPGSGKTTALERLLLRIAERGVKHFGIGHRIPILARLGDFQNPELLHFIEQSLEREVRGRSSRFFAKYIDRLLEKERVILLLDALDEALGETRQEIIKGLRAFASSDVFSHIPMIITARTHQDPRAGLPGFEVYEIQDLDDDAVNTFIDVYKPAYEETELLRQNLEDTGLLNPKGLARNPFWLRLIITSGIVEPVQSILVDKAIDSLLEREWDKPETDRSWSRVQLREEQLVITKEALAHFAFSMSLNKELSSTRDRAETKLGRWLQGKLAENEVKPRDILALGRDAQILIYRIDPIRFRHRLIQEFLTAYSMAHNEQRAMLQIVQENIYDTDWWTTFQLFSGLAPYSEELIDTILSDPEDLLRLLLALILLFNLNDIRYANIAEKFLSEFQKINTDDGSAKILNAMKDFPKDMIRIFARFVESDNDFIRRGATSILIELGLGYPEVTDLFISLLEYKTIRNEITDALTQIGESTIPRLIGCLTHPYQVVAEGAAVTLGKIGDKTVNPLTDFLSQAGTKTTYHHQAEKMTLEELWDEADDADLSQEKLGNGPYWAIRALGKSRSQNAAHILLSLLRYGDSETREAAIEGLKELAEVATPTLRNALDMPDPYIRQRVIQILGHRESVDRSRQKLRDADGSVRAVAIDTLVQLQDNSVISELIPMLKDSTRSVRIAIIRAVQLLGDYPISDALLKSFLDVVPYCDQNEADQVARALISRDTDKAQSFLNAVFGNHDAKLKLRATIIVGALTDTQALAFLTALVKDKDITLRTTALQILHKKLMRNEEIKTLLLHQSMPELIAALSWLSVDINESTSHMAIMVLSKLQDIRMLEPYWIAINSVDLTTLTKLFNSLPKKESDNFRTFILKCISRSDPHSDLAIEIIRFIGDRNDVDTLMDLSTVSEEKRNRIKSAINEIQNRAKIRRA